MLPESRSGYRVLMRRTIYTVIKAVMACENVLLREVQCSKLRHCNRLVASLIVRVDDWGVKL